MFSSLSSTLFAPRRASLLSLLLPCVLWTQGPESAQVLKDAGIDQICVPAAPAAPAAPAVARGADAGAGTPAVGAPAAGMPAAGVPAPAAASAASAAWRAAGIAVRLLDASDIASRDALTTPGITARAGLASPTRVPWVTANGWQLRRKPAGKFAYDVPAGRGAIAAAEAFAYGADATLKIDPADLADVGAMLAFLAKIPAAELPDVADIGVVDDGTPMVGEVMNLLERRNLLFQIVKKPSPRYSLNITLGSKLYPQADAADPSAFALKIRHRLTDAHRALRIYGSEVVIARLTGNAHKARLQLVNYAGREIQGLRVRLRGTWRPDRTFISPGPAATPPSATSPEPTTLTDVVNTAGATEFSVPTLGTYAVIDLTPAPRPKQTSSPKAPRP